MLATLTEKEKSFIIETCGPQCLEFLNHLKTGSWDKVYPPNGWHFAEDNNEFRASFFVDKMYMSENDIPSDIKLYTFAGERTIRFGWQKKGADFRIPGAALIIIRLDNFKTQKYYSVSTKHTWETFEEWINHPLVVKQKINMVLDSLK